MKRITFSELVLRIEQVLLAVGMLPQPAALSARLTAETDRDGVRTHGIARLPRFLQMVHDGVIDLNAEPVCEQSHGALESWNAHGGPGNLAAYAAMGRACTIAQTHGLGLVALRNTNHWMRAGSYGWQAADHGCAAMCWSNTMPNMPAWGGATASLGNNPMVLAIPRSNGAHLVLDFAMTQFSFGALGSYSARGEQLPVPGGYDAAGQLTTDPEAIEQSGRALPIGFWKGSSLAFMLDVFAAALSGGNLTADIQPNALRETGMSQIFLAIAPANHNALEKISQTATRAVDVLHATAPVDPAKPLRYPGEHVLRQRADSMQNGVPIEDAVWQNFLQLEAASGV